MGISLEAKLKRSHYPKPKPPVRYVATESEGQYHADLIMKAAAEGVGKFPIWGELLAAEANGRAQREARLSHSDKGGHGLRSVRLGRDSGTLRLGFTI